MELSIFNCDIVDNLLVLLVGSIEFFTCIDTAVGIYASQRLEILRHPSPFRVVLFAAIIETLKPLWIRFSLKIAFVIVVKSVEFLTLVHWFFLVVTIESVFIVRVLHLIDIIEDFLLLYALARLTFFDALLSNRLLCDWLITNHKILVF